MFARVCAAAYDRSMRRVLLLLSTLARPALADVRKPTHGDASAATHAEATGATHNEGDYGGVVPGTKHTPPKPVKVKGMLSWVGFEPKEGGAEVFLQSIAPFEVDQHVENGVLVVHLSGLNRLGQNTWRPIDARYFETPISRIVARKVAATRGKNAHPAGIELRITFKNTKEAKEGELRTATESDGCFYAYLTWSGTAPAEGGTMAEPEK
jgi:hypothetical protein